MKYRKINNKKFMIVVYIVIAVALLAVGILLYWFYTERMVGYKPGEETFQNYSGNNFDYSADTAFYRTDAGGITAKINGQMIECPSTPLIFTSGDGITITRDMSLTTGDNAKVQGKLLTFTKLENADGIILLTKDDGKGQAIHGYLYDGEDTYVFLEDTVLTIGNQSYSLGALSYAVCQYDEQVEFYNTYDQTDKVVSLENTDVTAESETFKIDIGMDIKFDEEGKKAMIYTSISQLDTAEMAK